MKKEEKTTEEKFENLALEIRKVKNGWFTYQDFCSLLSKDDIKARELFETLIAYCFLDERGNKLEKPRFKVICGEDRIKLIKKRIEQSESDLVKINGLLTFLKTLKIEK